MFPRRAATALGRSPALFFLATTCESSFDCGHLESCRSRWTASSCLGCLTQARAWKTVHPARSSVKAAQNRPWQTESWFGQCFLTSDIRTATSYGLNSVVMR